MIVRRNIKATAAPVAHDRYTLGLKQRNTVPRIGIITSGPVVVASGCHRTNSHVHFRRAILPCARHLVGQRCVEYAHA